MQIAASLLTVTSTMQNGILGLSGFALIAKEVQLAALVVCTNLMKHMTTTRLIKFSLTEIDLIANPVGIREKTHIGAKNKSILALQVEPVLSRQLAATMFLHL